MTDGHHGPALRETPALGAGAGRPRTVAAGGDHRNQDCDVGGRVADLGGHAADVGGSSDLFTAAAGRALGRPPPARRARPRRRVADDRPTALPSQ
ncbi:MULTISPECIES: hypothetical protein [unclassified Streptomyces]|uniref:hypothetical protein n=1 Tax=unclassified Streptomyces TaxID=2593676 RepID=UPI003D7230A7